MTVEASIRYNETLTNNSIKKQIQLSTALYTLLISTYFLYSFGLNSDFFLDDLTNLQTLSNITEFNFDQITLFSLSGSAGPTGRPLSLLTFALQFTDWPNNSFAFKYINLMIHLINTILVFILSKQLFHFQLQTRNKCFELALFVAAIWAIHPIQVTTVLYCVQRMTELSATFVLLGIISYLHGRKQLNVSVNSRSAYIWMTTGIILGTALSMLNKENGVLILLFILVIEKTIIHFPQTSLRYKTWQYIFIYLPIAIISAYFIYKFDAVNWYKSRDFSFSERLITENAVIFDYLKKIVFPSFNSFSLYYDDFPISKTLTDSFQTIAGFILISSSIVFSLIYRKKYPLISFGFLWYFSGHIIESSFIAIELYFEHRNYLPLVGIAFIFVSISYKTLFFIKSTPLKNTFLLVLFLYLSFLAFITYTQTTLWGSQQQAKLTWALEKPNSKRAQSTAANIMASYGEHEQALFFTKKIIKLSPGDPAPYLSWLHYRCTMTNIPHPDLKKLYRLARSGPINSPSILVLNKIVLDRQDGNCKNLTYSELSSLFKSIELNPNLTNKPTFFQIYSMLEGNQGHYIRALNLANQSISFRPSVRVAFFQLKWLTLLGDYQTAFDYIARVKEINAATPKTSILFKSDIQEWESFLLKKLSPQNKTLDKPS